LLTIRAPAKINLTLHILGRRAEDGFHELESLVAFTGFGDILSLDPGPSLALTVEGPTASGAGAGAGNLVFRAAESLAARVPGLMLGSFALQKFLPVAAGIGGGSSDAAAALRLLARANSLAPDDPNLLDAARATGADVSVCLTPSARFMCGMGEIVGEAIALPPLPAVLVNPGAPTPTKAVFAGLRLEPGERLFGARHPAVDADMTQESLWSALAKGRNDLEDPAGVETRVIVDVLAVLRAAKGCRLARMSGSGATCFGLFASRQAAERARATIAAAHPGWWVKAAMLR